MRVDPADVAVHDRRPPDVQRSRKLGLRQERDKMPTRHSHEVEVVDGDNFPGADGQPPDPKGVVGDGRSVRSNDEKLLRVAVAALGTAAFAREDAEASSRNAPVNALGYLRVMFAVDDLDDTLARLREHGAQLVDEVVQYEDVYRLCYIRGPEGILIGLAEQIG